MAAMGRRATAATLAVAVLASGCSTLDVWMFRKAELSGVDAGEFQVQLIDRERKSTVEVEKWSRAATTQPASAPELDAALRAHCQPKAEEDKDSSGTFKTQGISPALVPVAAALVSSAFNIFADRRQRAIEGIVASAQAAYSTTLLIPPQAIRGASCLVLRRSAPPAPPSAQPSAQPVQAAPMVAVLKLIAHPVAPPTGESAATGVTQVFSLQPVYVRLRDLVAVTQRADKPVANLSFAVSIKAVGRGRDGLGRLVPVGEGVASAEGVAIGKDAAASCTDGSCAGSDLVTYPGAASVLSLTVAVVEQGSTGFDDKAALAELAALKEALGPAIDEAVRLRLEKE